ERLLQQRTVEALPADGGLRVRQQHGDLLDLPAAAARARAAAARRRVVVTTTTREHRYCDRKGAERHRVPSHPLLTSPLRSNQCLSSFSASTQPLRWSVQSRHPPAAAARRLVRARPERPSTRPGAPSSSALSPRSPITTRTSSAAAGIA